MSERAPKYERASTPEVDRLKELMSSLEASVENTIANGDTGKLQRLRDALSSVLALDDEPGIDPPEASIDTEPEVTELPDEGEESVDVLEYSTVRPDRSAIELPILDPSEAWPEHTAEIGGSTYRLERSEAERVFERVEIRGDGLAGELTPELLEQAGLLPRHQLKAEGRTLWFSHGYDLGDGRVAVTGYVEDDDGSIVARSYYRSNSQGVWRYLPQYSVNEGEVNWYSKGYGEESITLPASLQEGLTRSLEDDGGILSLDPDVAQAAFAGTARIVGAEGTVYHRNVSEYPRHLSGMPERSAEGELPAPETVQLSDEQSPNFANKLASWRQDTSLYGRVHYDVYPSNDGKLKYVFCRDVKGRAWVSGVENNSPLESTGLREEWLSGGALTTPAYEYAQQAGDYGNDADTRGHYVDMHKNYLSKVPAIQEYIANGGSSVS